jgi:uncharacterized membrane protein
VRRRLALIALVLATFGWNAALLAAPAGEPRALSATVYLAGSLVCHQQPERSFYRDGARLPVCARCLGLYVGAGLGVLGWLLLAGAGEAPKPTASAWLRANVLRRTLVGAALPTLITVALAWSGVWDAGNLVRAVSALPLGGVIGAVVAAVVARDLR